MTFEETRSVLKILQAEYPQSFRGMGKEDAEAKLNLWTEMFANDSVELVKKAVNQIISDGKREFAPNVGVVKAQMQRIKPKKGAGEAWQAAIEAGECHDAAEKFGSVSRYARLRGVSWDDANKTLTDGNFS